ncbi:sensor histidine kinase [Sphingobacterium sp. WOUb80]|uniref:sensor histidine kinase n=1 Tax=Sphingobacterium sp. WOUb80 TaxID=3234028 RepID=UPI003CEB60A5
MERLIRDCTDDLDSKKHPVEIVCDPDLYLFADRAKIDQVISNLVSNAVKYSPSGGKITVGTDKSGDKTRIFVRDEGIGIDLKHQKNIFKSFYRVDNLNTSNISGFGIGLYLVAEILRQHGSEIQLESAKGKGSTFYFDL